MDTLGTQLLPSKPNQDNSTFSKKKQKKISDESEQIFTSLTDATTLEDKIICFADDILTY
ncbi:hypothetical protein J1N35_021056 [Gossypium stocksii]|uniref:Uncharacterized protein n=1 Tax=Gossypium stocksii TaxID=47602 RepID=A0A9D4A1L3_9ROSI|nr:hypothetical protein J1N35_021056 [Gossypium stocksii]